jgi:hypothetical protein
MTKPWHEGGKEDFMGSHGLTMTHDELKKALGKRYRVIEDAGFVLVPRQWREEVLKILDARAKERKGEGPWIL